VTCAVSSISDISRGTFLYLYFYATRYTHYIIVRQFSCIYDVFRCCAAGGTFVILENVSTLRRV